MRRTLPTEDLEFIVQETADVWRALAGARLFITGGTGFVGSWLLEAIQHANDSVGADMDVVVLSRAPEQASARAPHLFGTERRTSLIAGDVTHFDQRLGHIDVCIHAATDVADPAKASDHQRIFDAGVTGTRRVLDAALSSGATRFLLTSSGAVYGPQPTDLERIPETYRGAPDPLDVRTAYGQSKRAAEWLACAYASANALTVAIARIFALLGPGMPLDGPFAAGNFVRDALRGTPIAVRDGKPVRSYLYAADACIWLLRILYNGANASAYNVGAERPISIAELARDIAKSCDRPVSSVDIQAVPGDALAPRYVPDTSKARSTLGLAEYTPFDIALTKTINWNRDAVLA
jgi:dTDP-glucose 4,6-dehydratase